VGWSSQAALALLKGITVVSLVIAGLVYFADFPVVLVHDPNRRLPRMLAGLPLVGLWFVTAAASRRR
jgi:hypothetical protein